MKYAYLAQIWWIMDVDYVGSLKMYVVWILNKLVEYEKSHIWSQRIIWICKWVYGRILSHYVKKNIEKCVSLVMKWNWGTLANIRCVSSEINIGGL